MVSFLLDSLVHVCVASVVCAAIFGASEADAAPSGGRLLFTGTFTDTGAAEGIYAFRFDETTGALTSLGLAAKTPSPAWIAVHPDGRHLYAANEVDQGTISAFALDPATGRHTLLNQQSAHGARPCHFAIDPTGRALIVASYNSGTVALLPIGRDGRLGESTAVVQHKGSSVNAERQSGPHAHQAVVDPSGRYVLVVDLGLDKILVYDLDAARGPLVPHTPAGASVAPGAGPRHLVFSKDGTRLFVINELDNTIAPFTWDSSRGILASAGPAASTLPNGYKEKNSTAEILMHPSGRVLYGTNRGHDTIVRVAVDGAALRPLDYTPINGREPRHVTLDPTGRWLLAGGQNSNTLSVFSVDASDGGLTPVGTPASTPTPVCIVFVP
jgi:6-phosphogluconolactonase